MLVLSRRVGESALVGDNIVVTVLGVRGKQVRLGFTAPRGVPIRRTEPQCEKRPAPASEEKESNDWAVTSLPI